MVSFSTAAEAINRLVLWGSTDQTSDLLFWKNSTAVVNNEIPGCVENFYFPQVSSQPVWTRRPLLSDVELVLLRLFGDRILRSDVSQLWAVHLSFISSPRHKPDILTHATFCASLCILGVLNCVIWFAALTCLAHGFLYFTRPGGEVQLALPQPDVTSQSLLFLPLNFWESVSVNRFRLAAVRLTPQVSAFSSECQVLTSSLVFVVETAVGKYVCLSQWFLVYMQEKSVFLCMLEGSMRDNNILWT